MPPDGTALGQLITSAASFLLLRLLSCYLLQPLLDLILDEHLEFERRMLFILFRYLLHDAVGQVSEIPFDDALASQILERADVDEAAAVEARVEELDTHMLIAARCDDSRVGPMVDTIHQPWGHDGEIPYKRSPIYREKE